MAARITRFNMMQWHDGRDRKLLNSRPVGFWQHTGANAALTGIPSGADQLR
jgi:hypothetical protein